MIEENVTSSTNYVKILLNILNSVPFIITMLKYNSKGNKYLKYENGK